jgi:outer membrane protein OmpA-like peptidoglycan-associated protein
MKHLIRTATVIVAAGLGLTACATGTSGRPAPSPPDGAVSTPVVGILVGTSPLDHGRGLARLWTADARLVAAAAGRARARVALDRCGAGPWSSDVMYEARVMNTNGQNSLIRKTQLQAAEGKLVRAFAHEDATTTPGPTDVISCVRAMAQHLAAFGRQKTTDVLIWGSAVQTAAPVNLTDPAQLADPSTTLQTVVSQGLLSRSLCTGWRVYMVDGSLSPGGGLDSLQDEQLREFWREFFARCGGRLVLWDTTLPVFPARGEVPPASWTTEAIVPLPDKLLFAFGSSALIPNADAVLLSIATRARRQHLLVSIIGTASPDGGTSAYNHHLSVRRADAVRDRLIALGLPRDQIIHVAGVGTAGRSPGSCLVHGQLDEAICSQLRHVVIILSPVAAPS